MKVREFFSKFFRRKGIICKGKQTKKDLALWFYELEMKLELSDVEDLLNSVGLESPITLSEVIFGKNSLFGQCVTNGRTVKVEFVINYEFPYGEVVRKSCRRYRRRIKDYEVSIDDEDVFSKYRIRRKEDETTRLELLQREFHRDGKVFKCDYNDFFYGSRLIIDDIHALEVAVTKLAFEEKEFLEWRNREAINEYLMSLDNSLVVNEVYKKLIELLELSDEELNDIDKIIVSYEQQIRGKQVVVRAKINKEWSTFVEYAYIEDDCTYHFWYTGECEFVFVSDDGEIIIAYNIWTNEEYIKHITGTGIDIDELKNNAIANFKIFHIENPDFFKIW